MYGKLITVTWRMWNFGIKKRKLESLVDQARQACVRIRELRCAERLTYGLTKVHIKSTLINGENPGMGNPHERDNKKSLRAETERVDSSMARCDSPNSGYNLETKPESWAEMPQLLLFDKIIK
jgi:hypothetical protein